MQVILVTGGTGTVGRELVRQLYNNGDRIIVYSRNEVAQVEMSRIYPDVEYIIGDVRDYKALKEACKGVEIIYHLAAIKHVPVCEKQPKEAIKTNVYGTMNVVKAANKNGAFVVFMSTDKAEAPTCVYGNTKAIAEKAVIGVMKARFRIVRSGNIFGSSGSVIPFFVKKIKEENCLSLTNGDMTRFFISVKDLVENLISVEKKFKAQSFKMIDVARIAIRLYGDENTKIEYTGIRPGEKMHETLNGDNSLDCLGSEKDLLKLFVDWHG